MTPAAIVPNRLELIAPSRFPLVAPGDDLVRAILDAFDAHGTPLQNDDVLVLAQKIVSKAEGRYVSLSSVRPSRRAVEMAEISGKDPRVVELILAESCEVLRCVPGIIIVETTNGYVLANAGIDVSNVEQNETGDRVLLLPKDPDLSCERLRSQIHEALGVDLGVIINDSLGRAWRNGTVGVALGASGIPPLQDMRGMPDLFGRHLQTTEVATADEIAAAASLLMGQANEGRPVVLIRGMSYPRQSGSVKNLIRPREQDLFR